MEQWSILSIKMCYPQHPRLNTLAHVQDSPDQVNQWASDPNNLQWKIKDTPIQLSCRITWTVMRKYKTTYI